MIGEKINKLDGTIKKTLNNRLFRIDPMKVIDGTDFDEIYDDLPKSVYTNGKMNTLYFVLRKTDDSVTAVELYLNGVRVFGEKNRYDTAIALVKMPEGD